MAGGAVRGEESGGGRGDGWSSGQDLLDVVYLVKQQGKTMTDFSVFESKIIKTKKNSIFFFSFSE